MRVRGGGLREGFGRNAAAMQPTKPMPRQEPRWHAALAVLAALALYITLPPRLTIGPAWVAPALVLGLLVPLSILAPRRRRETRETRVAAIALIAIVNFFNLVSMLLLIRGFLHPLKDDAPTAAQLLLHGMQIWMTNVLVFGLWYWELDGRGPDARAHADAASAVREADFLFPQLSMMMSGGPLGRVDADWKPSFVDYLYVAYTNATAFSPTDTMPLSPLAKVLMMVQSFISLLTIAIVLARAISVIQ